GSPLLSSAPAELCKKVKTGAGSSPAPIKKLSPRQIGGGSALFFCPNIQMVVNDSCFAVFNVDEVGQVNHAAVGNDIAQDPAGPDGNQQRPEFHLIQRIVGNPLLKHHLGMERTPSVQNNLIRLHPEGGGNSLQARDFTFLIGDVPAAVPVFHGPFSEQLDDLRLLVLVAL